MRRIYGTGVFSTLFTDPGGGKPEDAHVRESTLRTLLQRLGHEG